MNCAECDRYRSEIDARFRELRKFREQQVIFARIHQPRVVVDSRSVLEQSRRLEHAVFDLYLEREYHRQHHSTELAATG